MGFLRLAALFLLPAATSFAQFDATSLRAKFGAPLHREVFTVRPGIEMIVDYSPTSTSVCRLELPGQAPMPADARPGVGIDPKKIMDELLLEIVPLSIRGKERVGMCQTGGINSICSTDYDNLSIIERWSAGGRTAVIVKFKTAGCSE